jgi:sugar phosphate isomerase/epimerase
MMNRRSFVKVTAGAALGGVFGLDRRAWAADVAAGRSLDRIGVQLYTVRSLMEKDFAGTLKAVAEVGFEEVEFAGYFDHRPEEVKAILDRLGLTAPASHVSIDSLRGDLAGTIEQAQAVGHDYLICPWLAPEERVSIESYKTVAGDFNEVGKACRDAGLRFGYHNHDFEFETIDGQLPFDVLLDETDPELVEFELDLFWITKGGEDPFRYFDRYPGRFTLCHVKDMTENEQMVDVGAGRIDFKAIFGRAEQAGLEHFFVEHDEPEDPLASIKASHDYLEALRF